MQITKHYSAYTMYTYLIMRPDVKLSGAASITIAHAHMYIKSIMWLATPHACEQGLRQCNVELM